MYSIVKSSLDGQNKLNVHAPRDGTAAGRHGGAARDHLIVHENCTLSLTVTYSRVHSTVYSIVYSTVYSTAYSIVYNTIVNL